MTPAPTIAFQLLRRDLTRTRLTRPLTRPVATPEEQDDSLTATAQTLGEYLTLPIEWSAPLTGSIMRIALGEETPPLVLLQHFRRNLAGWDPALINALASTRRVVTFGRAGVGGSTGMTPSTIGDMARDAIAFVDAMESGQVDLLGFSISSFVTQEIALIRAAAIRRLILASSAPRGADGMRGWAPEVIGAVGAPPLTPTGI